MDLLHLFRDLRRKKLVQQPFPAEWGRIMDQNAPCCRHLHPDERTRLEDLVKVFISEKYFEGCAGMTITDEIKVTVAAHACLLLLNLRHDYYEHLVSILVYPETFMVQRKERGDGGVIAENSIAAGGLSSTNGVVVLSWPDTTRGSDNPGDGFNVIFHEFAHQLDQLDGNANGAPILESGAMYQAWARVLGAEYKRLLEDVESGTPTMISAYGATNPAEFFAVVTELFFEKPTGLKREHAALYEEFREYYHQDPAARDAPG